jgi:hypothetical protein
VAVELLSPGLATEAELSDGKDYLLLTRFAGSSSAVEQQVEQAIALLACDHPRSPTCFAEDDTVIWKSLAALPLRFMSDVVWRVGLQPNDVGSFLQLLERTQFGELLWHAGLGDGRIRVVARLRSEDNGSEEQQTEFVEGVRELRAVAESLGGSLVLEHAPPAVKNALHAWGNFGAAGGIMQRIKQQLDAQDLLSPGRFGF